MHPNDFAFQQEACRCYEDVKNGLPSLKYKCNKQNIEMKVKIMPRSRGKEKKQPTDLGVTLRLMVQGDVLVASWGFILMTSSHILSAFFLFPVLTLSPRDLPCLQESMARKRIYSLKEKQILCFSLLSMKGFSMVIPTFESFLSSLSFQALVTIPQISTNTWADSLLQKCLVPTNT